MENQKGVQRDGFLYKANGIIQKIDWCNINIYYDLNIVSVVYLNGMQGLLSCFKGTKSKLFILHT